VLAKLFTNSGRQAPANSLEILEEVGLTGTVGEFTKEQEEVTYRHRRLLASETYSKLKSAKWPATAIVRLLTLLKMEDFEITGLKLRMMPSLVVYQSVCVSELSVLSADVVVFFYLSYIAEWQLYRHAVPCQTTEYALSCW